MKKLARKFLAMLLTAAIAVSGLVVTAVSAGAEGVFDNAIKIEELEYQTKQFTENSDKQFYEIVIPKVGDITLRCDKSDLSYAPSWRLLNTNAEEIDSGHFQSNTSDTIKSLKKGTYFLEVHRSQYSNEGQVKFYYSFTATDKPIISLSATIKKGDTFQLGSVTENYDGKVTWLSTKKTVATVSSKGLVTAKKAGTTYIRAQLDNGDYVEIKVVVKK